MSNIDIANIVPPSFRDIKEWNGFRFIVQSAVQSGFTPCKNAHEGMVIALRGRELNIPPIEALNTFQVIQGKLSLSAEGMLSQVYKKIPGAQCEYVTPHDKSHEEAEYRVTRPGGKPQSFKFTKEDAERAGLWGRGGWAKYPAAMLRSRCVSAMVRGTFPEALAGNIYTPEEVEHFDIGKAPPKGQLATGAPSVTKPKALSMPKAKPAPVKLEDYEIPSGSKKGKKLGEMSRMELSILLGSARKAKGTKHAVDVVEHVEEFLKQGGGYVGTEEPNEPEESEGGSGGPVPLSEIPGVASITKKGLNEEDKFPFEK
jgi:hypothetical protein